MPTNTYVALATQTLSTAAATVTFSSISGAYTDLVLVVSAKTNTTAAQIYMTINGDAGSNYSRTILYGTGSAAGSARNSNQTVLFADYYGIMNTTDFNADTFHFMNYSNTTTYKTVLSRTNLAASGVDAMAHLWRSTSAITSILVGNYGYNFAVGSTFSLYGIASSGAGAKATGGTVTSDANYYYHTFLASGTFTPTQSLSCDYLVVAGGGGGGDRVGGGGGAGGFRTGTSFSVTTTPYTVTIGSGGAGGSNPSAGTAGTAGTDSVFGSITSTGGGRGGSFGTSQRPSTGGSGGGAGAGDANNTLQSGAAGNTPSTSPIQGYAGGSGNNNANTAVNYGYTAGGGGGSGGVGADGVVGSASGGTAGIGTSNSYSGSAVTYATGGAGSDGYTLPSETQGATGGANTGNGGGGSGGPTYSGAAGGSGIIIVRYAK